MQAKRGITIYEIFMKKTPLKRKSKTANRKIQDELWQECRRIQFKKYGDVCYTCKKPIQGANRHLGHFIPNSVGGALLRYNLDNLRPQCYYCNINCGGQGAVFYRELLKDEGKKFIDKLFILKTQTVKATDLYLKLLEEYKLL